MSSTVTASARQYTAANSEYHSIADASQTGLDGGDVDFWFGAWIYLDSTGVQRQIISKWANGGATNNQYALYVSSSNVLNFIVTPLGNVAVNTNVATTLGAFSSGAWYWVEGWHDATNDVIGVTYNRGTANTAAHLTGVSGGAEPFCISSGKGAADFWNGRIGPVVATSGIPTSGERDAMYNSGNGVLYKDRPTLSSATYVSWWDGVETSGVRIDAFGINNLTDNNTVTSAVGKVTYTAEDASQFTAANSEFLDVATSGALVPGDNDFSVTGWVYYDSVGTNRAITGVLNFGGAYGNNYSWLVAYISGTNVLRFDVDSLGTAAGGLTTVSSAVQIATSNWYFFAVRHDATANTIEIRVNGETWVSAAHSGGAYAGNSPFRIGAYGISGSPAGFHSGRIADVNYWNSKISNTVADEIYQRGFGRDYSDITSTTGLVGWWELTEASGNRADSHGSFTLTNNNTVTGAAGVVYDVPAVVSSSTKSLALLGVG